MTPEQENDLFKSIGSIEATQKAMLDTMMMIQSDIHQAVKDVNTRVDKVEAQIESVDIKVEKRLEKVETKVTNLRIKVAAAGGAGGLTVLMIAELIKLQTGGL